MKIQRSVLDEGVAGLSITGEFDSFAANPFLEQVEACVQSGVSHIVVNLRLVLFINSTAIGSLIKARKRVRGLGGDLVLSAVSERVRDALDTLGLGSVIKSFENDDEAVDHLLDKGDDSVAVPSENAVLLKFSSPSKQERIQQLGNVAKMASLEENGIYFTAKGDDQLFKDGTDVRVKFRLPLFRRAYYFDIPCVIAGCEAVNAGEVKVFAEFGDIFEEDQKAITQFVRDLRLLKDEIRSAGSD